MESIINQDPTLRFFIYESQFDYNKLDHQVNVTCGALKVALSLFIDQRIKELNNP